MPQEIDNNKTNNMNVLYNYDYVLDSLSKECSEILAQEPKIINSGESLEDAIETMGRISSNNDYDTYKELINNAPIFLFRKKVEKVISYLLGLGLKEEEIIELLCTSFNKCVELSEKANNTFPMSDEEYFKFATKCKKQIKNGNVSPESYKVRVKRIMTEHEELLRRLK